MKYFTLFVMLLLLTFLNAQDLIIVGDGNSYWLPATPTEDWLVVKENNNFVIYDESLTEICQFNLSNEINYIYGISRDFDDDDNIEILYQTEEYTTMYLRDISTNQIQMSRVGNSSYRYYGGQCGYFGNERTFIISRYNLSTYTYDESYIYRSGFPVEISEDNVNSHALLSNLKNFPNPFNPITTISFNMPENSQHEQIELQIFNVKGQKIDQLEITNCKSGMNEITWNAENFASGVYFYKLKIGNQKSVSHMLLLK